jgi:hypothetical protein
MSHHMPQQLDYNIATPPINHNIAPYRRTDYI